MPRRRRRPTPELLEALDPSTATSRLAELGRWDLVEAALAHGLPAAGADPTVRDPQFRATPAEWADFFGHPSVATLLGGLNDR